MRHFIDGASNKWCSQITKQSFNFNALLEIKQYLWIATSNTYKITKKESWNIINLKKYFWNLKTVSNLILSLTESTFLNLKANYRLSYKPFLLRYKSNIYQMISFIWRMFNISKRDSFQHRLDFVLSVPRSKKV